MGKAARAGRCLVIAVALVASGCHHRARAPRGAKAAAASDTAADWAHVDAAGADAGEACTIHTHDDAYYGFSVGQPDGWRLDYSTGTIVVSKDEKNLVGALVYPARMRRTDIPPERFAALFAEGIGNVIRDHGGTFELRDRVTDGKVARATAVATVDGVALQGPLVVAEEPGFLTVRLYWAPADSLAAEEPTLRQVVSCFHRNRLVTAKQPVAPPGGPQMKFGGQAQAAQSGGAPAALLVPFRGRYFVGAMPAGWRIVDEGDHGIDLVSGDGKQALGFGWIMSPTTGAGPLLQQNLATTYPGAHIIAAGPMPSTAPGWGIMAAEFDGAVKGVPIHGMARVAVSTQAALEAAWSSTPATWDSSKATLAAIAGTIQITSAAVGQVNQEVRAQLASGPHAQPSGGGDASDSMMAGWEAREAEQDRSARGWDDAIRGQDRATSPSTGEQYVCPYNAWDAAGPSGPGYYRALPGGGEEQLTVQQ
jgi:hypothetical protein